MTASGPLKRRSGAAAQMDLRIWAKYVILYIVLLLLVLGYYYYNEHYGEILRPTATPEPDREESTTFQFEAPPNLAPPGKPEGRQESP